MMGTWTDAEGTFRANWCSVDFDNDGNARIQRIDETGRVVAMVQVPREEVTGIGVSLLPSGVTIQYPEEKKRTIPPGPSNFTVRTPYPFAPKREDEAE